MCAKVEETAKKHRERRGPIDMSQLAIWMAKESAELLSMECAAPGEYRVRYIPQHSGPVSFEVKLLGEALPGSPFTPNVLPCAMERLYVSQAHLVVAAPAPAPYPASAPRPARVEARMRASSTHPVLMSG